MGMILKASEFLEAFFVTIPPAWHHVSRWIRSGSTAGRAAIPMVVVLGLLGCNQVTTDRDVGETSHIVVIDDTGYAAEFRETPARIVSVAPNVTEIMFAIGAEDKLVGVTEQCDFPPEAKLKPKIGDFVNPSLEKIIAREPDLVIGCGTLHPVLARLRDLGVPVLSFNPVTIDELLAMIESIGAVVKRQEAANALTASLRADVQAVRSRVAQVKDTAKVKVFVEIWHDPLLTAGKGSFVNDLVETAGATNMAASVGNHYFEISQEHVLDANPDVILAAYMEEDVSARQMIVKRETWHTVSAVVSGRVFDDIDPDLLLRPSVRAVHTVRELAERFYPELFMEQPQ
jgi:iron complex transport system substrate-binding protein